MLEQELMLLKNDRCITIRAGEKWVFYNPDSQATIIGEDRIVTILALLETPLYFAELRKEFLSSYSDLDNEGFSESLESLIEAGIICVNGKTTKPEKSLSFKSNSTIPKLIAVHPTYRCNLSCTYCYNSEVRGKSQLNELSADLWESKLLSLQQKGVKRFDITGGEPLLRMDLLPTYRKLKSNGAIVELITNGLLIDSIETALEIAESFSRVSVSFDSIVPEEHEVCRGKGTHAKVIAAMKYLTEAGVAWQAKGVLHKHNASSGLNTTGFVEKLGGHEFALSIMVGAGLELDEIYEQYFKSGVKESVNWGDLTSTDNSSFDFNRKYGVPCSAARTECALDPEGNLYPCRVFMSNEMDCGNIFKTDIADIWENSEILRKIRNTDYKKIEECGDCSFLRIYLGGCRAIAKLESGSMNSCLNSFACALRKKIIVNVISEHALKALDEVKKKIDR